jgi:hypothetical protein
MYNEYVRNCRETDIAYLSVLSRNCLEYWRNDDWDWRKKITVEVRTPVVIFPPQNHGNIPGPVWSVAGVCLIYGTIRARREWYL